MFTDEFDINFFLEISRKAIVNIVDIPPMAMKCRFLAGGGD